MAQRAVSSANPIRHYWMQPCWPLLHGTDPYEESRRIVEWDHKALKVGGQGHHAVVSVY
jgi:hypothetical protein